MSNQIPFAIFSAQLASCASRDNATRNTWLSLQLEKTGLDFAPVRGSYQGMEENSYLVFLPEGDGSRGFEDVARLSNVWEQDSFLFVDAQRMASLHYSDGRVEFVGRFHGVPETEARLQDGWTRLDGRYYVVSA